MVRRQGGGATGGCGRHSPSLAPISESAAAVAAAAPAAASARIDTDEEGYREEDAFGAVPDAGAAAAAAAATTRPNSESTDPYSSETTAEDPSPIWLQTGDTGASWELTWPIWHMLPHGERKDIATRYGYKSIGEFEEYMTLTKAVGASGGVALVAAAAAAGAGGAAYDNAMLYEAEADPRNYGAPTVAERSSLDPRFGREAEAEEEKEDGKPHARAVTDDDASSTSTSSSDSIVEEEEEEADLIPLGFGAIDDGGGSGKTEQEHLDELIELGGPFLLLPDESCHAILSFLDVDAYGVAALVSPHWKFFTRSEIVYKMLCERCYLNQSRRKALHVSRFGGSYRNMLETRPRVRTGGGLYVLKYSEVKKIQRDMWTEIPIGAILETVYYRYMYFLERGRVLYALTSSPPHEMIPRLVKMYRTGEKDKAGVWGRYEVHRFNVMVWASQPWHDVRFELRILPSEEQVEGMRGRFCAMSLERHVSSASGDFDEYYSRDLVKYKVPDEYFRFLRDWRL